MQKFFIFLLLFPIGLLVAINFLFAQASPVFVFAKKTKGGVLLGVEITGNKQATYIYNWFISAETIFTEKTFSPTIKIPVSTGIQSISGNVKIISSNQAVIGQKDFNFFLPKPRVNILKVDKSFNLALPLVSEINQGDFFIASVFDFFQKPSELIYKWWYNGVNVGEGNSLILNSSNQKPSGVLKIIVSDSKNSNEYAIETKAINFR